MFQVTFSEQSIGELNKLDKLDQMEVIERRTQYRLDQAERKAHVSISRMSAGGGDQYGSYNTPVPEDGIIKVIVDGEASVATLAAELAGLQEVRGVVSVLNFLPPGQERKLPVIQTNALGMTYGSIAMLLLAVCSVASRARAARTPRPPAYAKSRATPWGAWSCGSRGGRSPSKRPAWPSSSS